MTRSEAIKILKELSHCGYIGSLSGEDNEALQLAIDSLEVDEAYNLMYESMRESTPEEREMSKKALGNISRPTGVTVDGLINGDTYIPIKKGSTNGDMIKACFPNATIETVKAKSGFEREKIAVTWNFEKLPSYYNFFYKDWWDAPYKEYC